MKNPSERPNYIFILGMHRSGTSCLTGGLERCGLYLGAASWRAQRTPRGYLYELEEVTRLHKKILAANGGSWHRPPAQIAVDAKTKRELYRISTKLSSHVPCGIKSPMMVFLLETWTEAVDSYSLVGTFRHPNAVVRSLSKGRSLLSEEKIFDLWLAYNIRLVRWHKAYGFPLIEFDLSDPEAYCKNVASVALTWGLSPDMTLLRQFVAPELDHSKSLAGPVPVRLQEVYEYLRQNRYQSDLSDEELDARLEAARKEYRGWVWSPDPLRRALRQMAPVLPASAIRLGRKWLRRLDRYR